MSTVSLPLTAPMGSPIRAGLRLIKPSLPKSLLSLICLACLGLALFFWRPASLKDLYQESKLALIWPGMPESWMSGLVGYGHGGVGGGPTDAMWFNYSYTGGSVLVEKGRVESIHIKDFSAPYTLAVPLGLLAAAARLLLLAWDLRRTRASAARLLVSVMFLFSVLFLIGSPN